MIDQLHLGVEGWIGHMKIVKKKYLPIQVVVLTFSLQLRNIWMDDHCSAVLYFQTTDRCYYIKIQNEIIICNSIYYAIQKYC